MNRPKINIKKTRLDKSIEFLTFFLLLGAALLLAIWYAQLPERVPIHFNWPTKDRNGMDSKNVLWAGILIFCLLTVGIFKLNQYPWIFNYPFEIHEGNAERHYRIATRLLRWLNLLLAILCIVLTVLSLLDGLEVVKHQ
jgi:uncharacterized membrane protein